MGNRNHQNNTLTLQCHHILLMFLWISLVSDVQKHLSKFPSLSRSPTALCQGILRGSSNTWPLAQCEFMTINIRQSISVNAWPQTFVDVGCSWHCQPYLAFCGDLAFPSANSAMSAKTFTAQWREHQRQRALWTHFLLPPGIRLPTPPQGCHREKVCIPDVLHISHIRLELFYISISFYLKKHFMFFFLCFSKLGPSQKFQQVEGVQKCLAQSILGAPKARPATSFGDALESHGFPHGVTRNCRSNSDLCSNSSSAETLQQRYSCFLRLSHWKPNSESKQWSHPGCMP